MFDHPVSPLRQRMIEDMTIRGFGEATQRDYLRSVKSLGAFIGRSPDMAMPDEIRQFQFNLREHGATPSKMNATVSGLRFFFWVTLKRPEIERWTQFVREPRKLPVILSLNKVARVIEEIVFRQNLRIREVKCHREQILPRSSQCWSAWISPRLSRVACPKRN